MSWLDFFRKKKEPIEEEPLIEKIELAVFEERIEKERARLEKKAESIKKEIENQVSELITELKDKIEPLKNINLENRKEHEKIKVLVQENLFFYTSHLERFISNLEKLDSEQEARQYIKELQSIQNNFAKQSYKNFEKSTILVGKELEAIKESLLNFSASLNKTLSENSKIFETIDLISEILPKIKNINEVRRIKEKINESQSSLDKERINSNGNLAALQEQYSTFRESPEFRRMLEEKEKIMNEINLLRKEAMIIKDEAKIKELMKHFHHDMKRRQILKDYSEKFMTALENDESLEIAKMSMESRGHDLRHELLNLKEKNRALKEKLKEKPSEKRLIVFEEKIKDLNAEINSLSEMIEDERKKQDRMNEKEAEILSNLNSLSAGLFENLEIVR